MTSLLAIWFVLWVVVAVLCAWSVREFPPETGVDTVCVVAGVLVLLGVLAAMVWLLLTAV